MKKLLRLVVIAGGIALAAKFAASKKAEWQGLTEAEARDKINSKLPKDIPSEKRDMVMDKVVSGLADAGMLREDAASPEPEDAAV